MRGEVTELYSDEDMARMEEKTRRWQWILAGLGAAALAACLGMIAFTNTLNAERMEITVVAVSTGIGWIVLYGAMFCLTPLRRELAHATMLRTEERETVQGEVTVTEERVAIRNSIMARRVEVRGEDGLTRVMVCESRAPALTCLGTAVLYTCHSYVAAYGVDP